MLLEKYIDMGVLFERLLQKSKSCPIKFDNGVIKVGDTIFGDYNCEYSFAVIEKALKEANPFRR